MPSTRLPVSRTARSSSSRRSTSSTTTVVWTWHPESSLSRKPKRTRTEPTPLDGVDVVLADLDGVVYAGPGALPHAVESLNRAAEEGHRLGYITNNASRTDVSVAEHLTSLGLHVAPEDVVTSPQAAMRLLADLVPAGSTLLVVGGEGLVVEVEKAGFVVTRSAEDSPAAVVQGFAPEVGWKQLAEAAYALATPVEEGGIPWIATNTDWTIPQARGIAPGNGTLVSAVHTAVGRLATVAGKPERPIFDVAVARTGARSPLFIGDRLDTDVQGARGAEMASVHVLTGIDRPKQLLAASPNQRPDYIVSDLRQLFEPYPATIVKGARTRVGDAVVEIDGVDLRIVSAGDRQIDLLRAGAAAIWNSGRAIFGFRVPEQLYADPFRVR
jgi:HAD superfamily hydrolase (TIGR01450 family)